MAACIDDESLRLTHVSDDMPGIRRLGAGRGFFYRDSTGRRITDPATLARIRALAIPPAWRAVWICDDADGHIQATGRDDRGRKQYRYHPDWTAHRDAAKFFSLSGFAGQLPRLRRQVDADLRQPGLCRARVLATVVRLLDRTLIRVGNDVYAAENKSYGLTTLRARHLKRDGTRLRFAFTGKSGQSWSLSVQDRRVANVVRRLQELPGQRLFRYIDEGGVAQDVRSQDVNLYIGAAMGAGYTSKHFRTWGATVRALVALADTPLPDTQREQAMVLNAVLDDVAQTLRNTRTVCRQCYVHPQVIEAWQAGRLGRQIAATRRQMPTPEGGADRDEALVLRWLARREAESAGIAPG